MTNREHEFLNLGLEYAEGIERAKVIVIPSTGREVRKVIDASTGAERWAVQPWNDNYWTYFDDLLDAVKCGTRPEVIRPIVYGRPQRNPPPVEIRKPFDVQRVLHGNGEKPEHDRFAVICKGSKPVFPNTHGDTELVTFTDVEEARHLADCLNAVFADHFDN